MISNIAWKNVWRNRTRSLVVMVAVVVGLIGGIFSVAFMVGMIEQRMSSLVYNEISHVQIHHPEFVKDGDLKFFIPNGMEMINILPKLPYATSATGRLKVNAMIATANNATGITLYGIIPEKEKMVTRIYTKLYDTSGTYFERKSPNDILISERTAVKLRMVDFTIDSALVLKIKNEGAPDEVVNALNVMNVLKMRNETKMKDSLELKLGKFYDEWGEKILDASARFRMNKKVVLTMQNIEGELVGNAYKVVGIYKTSNSMYDESAAFVPYQSLLELTGLPDGAVHEIAMLSENLETAKLLSDNIQKMNDKLLVQHWAEIQPDMAMMNDLAAVYYYFYIGLILFALAFGIINTMLMAVLERVKELGMLMAVGMTKWRIFKMIMLETLYLITTGAVVGMLLGALLVFITGEYGIDLSIWGEGLNAMGYDAFIYPTISTDFYIGVTIMVFLTGILSSIYPARKALRLNPAESLKTDM